jgi:hypothetical protein
MVKVVRWREFPLVILLAASLLVGCLTFRDYGTSWDEPLFYQYADAIPYAYSIQARLDGTFQIENSYGPSADDHKDYGPAYLLMARPVVKLLNRVTAVKTFELWHLANFLAFLAGVAALYFLCRRWISPWAAFGAAAFFATQPVLWGHGFINPKDIPFLSYFLIAVTVGFWMVDRLSLPGDRVELFTVINPVKWHQARRTLLWLGSILAFLALAALAFSGQIQALIANLVHGGYSAEPGSLAGWIFSHIASQAGSVVEAAYVQKGVTWFHLIRSLLAGLTGFILLVAGLVWALPKQVQAALLWVANLLAPLPTWPAFRLRQQKASRVLLAVLPAGIMLGLVTSIRVLGPVAGVLVLIYFMLKSERRSAWGMLVYLGLGAAVCYATWPYLWDAPLARFLEVFRHMSSNPKIVYAFYNGQVLPSNRLPASYLPVLLGITLSEPVWLLVAAGLAVAVLRLKRHLLEWRALSLTLAWFLIPFLYVVILRPPMYDGYRHFLFILPPVFVIAGLAFQAGLDWLHKKWPAAILGGVLLFPGILGITSLYPYAYTYYNSFVGGVPGVYGRFETDYWLTCYREIMQQVNQKAPPDSKLYVQRQPAIATQYARPGLQIVSYDKDIDILSPGDWLLLTTRTNTDSSDLFPNAPVILSVGRFKTPFCVVLEIH